MTIAGRMGWSGARRVDLSIRWSLYLLSASEPALVLLVAGADAQVGGPVLAVVLGATIAHTAACIALLRAGFGYYLGGPMPTRRVVALIGASTILGPAVVVVMLATALGTEAGGIQEVAAVVAIFVGATTCALTPRFGVRTLLAFLVGPAVIAGVLQAFGPFTADSPTPWALAYLWVVAPIVLTYRWSVWMLGTVWEIDRSRDVQARLAVAEERLRFARDLHDTLGRNLALITINSELASQLVRRGEGGAVGHLEEVRRVAQESMRDLREVVGGYRAPDLATELAGAQGILRAAGISTRVIGDGAALPRSIQTAMGWVVREATTNIIRHSDATTTKIELDANADGTTATLRIENDGVRCPHPGPGTAGHGLTGLRERLEGQGGELAAQVVSGASGDRFLVTAHLRLARP